MNAPRDIPGDELPRTVATSDSSSGFLGQRPNFDPDHTHIIDVTGTAKLPDPLDYRSYDVWTALFRKETRNSPLISDGLSKAMTVFLQSENPRSILRDVQQELKNSYEERGAKTGHARKRDYVAAVGKELSLIPHTAFSRLLNRATLEENRRILQASYRQNPDDVEIRKRRDVADSLLVQSSTFVAEASHGKPENVSVRFRTNVSLLIHELAGSVRVPETRSKIGAAIESLRKTLSDRVAKLLEPFRPSR